MKLHNTVEDKAQTNLDNVYKFKIKESVKSFQILSSSLYSDPVLAIIRELSTNAVDSHIAAGKADVPIEVHLPTSINPYFGVKDYGIGMDSDDVEVVFTTYFESTKNDNNDEMGGLGVGGKSPYSYTNNFTITAIKDGMKRLYTAFINDDGLPELARLGEFATDESNGVEIQVPVKPDDNRSFINKAKIVYAGFDVVPTFTGEKIEPFSYDVINELTENVHQYKEQGYYGHFKNAYVKMGYILYPINVDAITSMDDITVSQATTGILKSHIIINANVGDFDIQPSREGLTYTKNNVTRLLDITNNISDKLVTEMSDAIRQEYNMWGKIKLLKEYSSKPIYNLVMCDMIPTLNMDHYVTTQTSYYNTNVHIYGKDVFINDKIVEYGMQGYRDTGNVLAKKLTPSVHYGDDVVFVYATKPKGLVTDVRKHIKATSDKRMHIIIQNPPENMVDFWNDIKNPPTILSQNELKKPEKAYSPAKKTELIDNRFRVKYTGGGNSYNILSKEQLDTATNYYIPFERSAYPTDSVISKFGVDDVMYILAVFGVRQFYLSNIKQTKMVVDKDNWVRIDDFIEGKINEFSADSELHIHHAVYSKRNTLKHYLDSTFDTYDLTTMINTAPEFTGSKYDRLVKFAKKYDHDINATYSYVEKEMVTHMNKYPLLKTLTYDADPSAVNHYIKLIEGDKE